jgi:hypothetical protein
MAFTQVNWIAIVIVAVFNMILGTLWYGPFFGGLWLRIIGKKREELQSNPGMYIFSFIAALVAAYVLNVLISGLGLNTWWWGAVAGAVVWVGMGVTGSLTFSIFNGPPIGSWLLFSLYGLVVYTAGGILFALW